MCSSAHKPRIESRIDGVVTACVALSPKTALWAARDAHRWRQENPGQRVSLVLVDHDGELRITEQLEEVRFLVDHPIVSIRHDIGRYGWLKSPQSIRRTAVRRGNARREAAWV